jgi:RNA polymerase sigma factor (sigma-70 family)
MEGKRGNLMRGRGLETVSRDLDTLFHVGIVAGISDGQLLERFRAEQGNAGQAAFEEVVRRHGPMVLGVCHRILADRQAAEDAFQATFLVLALKAHSVRKRESLGPWLHGVAARVAHRARVLERRRRETELPAESLALTRTDGRDSEQAEVRSILDEELERLPEKYRRPVVLCYLEGQTQEEAARVLGWTKGTVSGRLARAKDLLRGRLARRGLASTAAFVGAYLAPESASAGVPSSLLLPTVRAAMAASLAGAGMEAGLGSGQAAALARGFIGAMHLGRIKAAVPLLLLGLGAAAVAAPMLRSSRPAVPVPVPARARNPIGMTPERLVPHVVGVGYTSDGKTVLSAQSDGLVRFWDPGSGKSVRTINLSDLTQFREDEAPAESHPSEARRTTLRAVPPRTPRITKSHSVETAGGRAESVLRDFAISPDGRLIAAVGSVSDVSQRRVIQGIWIWSLAERRPLRRIDVEASELHSLAFSPEGASLVTGDQAGKIQLWDVQNGEELLTLRLGEKAIRGIAFSPDGMTLAVTDLASGVQLWDLGGGRALGAVDGGSQPLALQPRFSPDGTLLAFGTAGGEVIVWDRAGGRSRARARVEPQTALAIAFAPDSQSLAVCGDLDGMLTVFDTATGRERWKVGLGPDLAAGGLAYSPDGTTIITGHGGVLRFLDAATGNLHDAH